MVGMFLFNMALTVDGTESVLRRKVVFKTTGISISSKNWRSTTFTEIIFKKKEMFNHMLKSKRIRNYGGRMVNKIHLSSASRF